MIISTNIMKTLKTARYYLAGSPSGKTKNIWIVIHGYGQLAGKFIQQFEFLINDETVVIAPEGLSRFYTGSATGELIGAGWMTKEERDNEIKDYIISLTTNKVYDLCLIDKYFNDNCKVIKIVNNFIYLKLSDVNLKILKAENNHKITTILCM